MSLQLPPVQYQIGASVDAYFVTADGLNIARSDTLVLEAINSVNWANYAFAMTDPQAVGLFEQSGGNAFPSIPVGSYYRYIRARQGVTAAPDDLSIGADGPWAWGGIVPAPTTPVGWPTTDDVIAKLSTILNVDGLDDAVENDLANLLNSIIVEIQGLPRGPRPGTGRRFTPITETRAYDGSGGPTLAVEDIVPGTPILVTAWDTTLSSVLLREIREGYGWNLLEIPPPVGYPFAWGSPLLGLFPMGKQNIKVNATWGFAASVPQDVWEAVRCETCHRAIIQGAVPLTGVGEIVQAGSFEINTASGISVWKESSPIALLHDVYVGCVQRYQERSEWRRRMIINQARRMA